MLEAPAKSCGTCVPLVEHAFKNVQAHFVKLRSFSKGSHLSRLSTSLAGELLRRAFSNCAPENHVCRVPTVQVRVLEAQFRIHKSLGYLQLRCIAKHKMQRLCMCGSVRNTFSRCMWLCMQENSYAERSDFVGQKTMCAGYLQCRSGYLKLSLGYIKV